MTERADIVLFVEHAARELDLACLYKTLLARDGLRVDIRSIVYDLERTLAAPCPAVAATPYCYSARDYGLYDIVPAWPGARYVNLAYEQIFLDIQKPFKAPRDEFAHQRAVHAAWSASSAAFLQESGVRPQNIATTGSAVMELYRTPYSRFFDSRETLARRHGLDSRKPWLLVPENYGVAFHNNAHLYAKGRITAEQAEQFQGIMNRSFAQAVDWWYQAARTGKAEVVLRPRPSIPEAGFADYCRATCGPPPDGLHIIKAGTAREWILAADVVASSYSTTLVEAAVAGKPVVMMQPEPLPEWCTADWFGSVPVADGPQAFLDMALERPRPSQALRAWAESLRPAGDAVEACRALLARHARAGAGEHEAPHRPADELFTKPLPAHERDRFGASDIAARCERWDRVLTS